MQTPRPFLQPVSGVMVGPMADKTLGFYGRLARAVMRNRGVTLAILGVVCIVSGWFTLGLRVDSDILHLMPQDEPTTKALEKLDTEEGGVNVLTIAAEADDIAARDAFMGELATQLEALTDVGYVLWKIDPALTYRLGVLQLPTEDLLLLRDRVRAALSLGSAISNPFMAARVLDLGPLTAKLETAGDGMKLASPEGVARMVVRPTGSAHDIPFARQFMAQVYAVIDGLDPEGRGVHVRWIGGAYRHNVEDYEGIVRDFGWTTVASFVLVLIIIAAAFRAPRAVFVIFAPLMMSNLWTLAVAAGTVGSLNSFTSFVNAVLIGLGVEFGVHLYARVREFLEEGHSIEEATERAWESVGGACTSAAFTSSAGFMALVCAHFAGFRQLGWLLALGLILTLIAEMVLMPVLLSWTEGKHAASHVEAKKARKIRRLPALYKLAPMTLMVLGSFTVVAGLFVRNIDFEYDLSELRRQGLAYGDLSERERALVRDSYAPVIVTYDSDAAMTLAHERLTKKIPGLAEEDGLYGAKVFSLRTILPVDQAERAAILQEIAALAADPTAVYLPAAVHTNLDKLAQIDFTKPMTPEDLPESVQHALGALGGTHRLLVIPAGNMWDMRSAAKLIEAIEREFPDQTFAGEYLTLGVLYRTMLRDGPVITLVAFLLVFLFTGADLRKVLPTIGAMGVLISGMAWWGALLVFADIKLSIVNFVGVPIVLGIGIDVMIHLIHRINEEGPGRIQKALATTGWASALGTSTTVVAFAALSLASSQGIRSLGLLVLLGEIAVTVAGFVLVPLGFATLWAWEGKIPQAEPDDED